MSGTTIVDRPSPEQVAQAFLTPAQPNEMPGAAELRIETAEGEIALTHAGSGPSVLLLHGWGGSCVRPHGVLGAAP